MPSIKPIYFRLLIFSFLILGLVTLGKLNSSRTSAGNLSGVSVTMSNSRLSFRGKVAADPGAGTIVTVGVDDAVDDGYLDPPTTKVADPLKIGDSLTFSTSTLLYKISHFPITLTPCTSLTQSNLSPTT